MPSFRRRGSVIDADTGGKPTPKFEDASGTADALATAAEAEAAEAEAAADAARERARAIRLEVTAAQAEPADDDAHVVDEEPGKNQRRSRRRMASGATLKLVAATLVVLCTLAFIGASVFMSMQHRIAVEEQRRTAEYAAAARQGVVTLMSLDFNTADDDVQRIIAGTTGQFRKDFEAQAADFARVARDSKVISEASVNSTAVKSMTENSAAVLVSATAHVTNSAGATNEPRSWRIAVDLTREGDQIKMSRVEFVP